MQYIGRDPVEGAIERLFQRDPDDFKVAFGCFPYMVYIQVFKAVTLYRS